MIITLDNGIKLDPDTHMAKTLAGYAVQKGLHDARVFLATHPGGEQTYLLVRGQEPEFENTQAEAVAAHIDMLVIANDAAAEDEFNGRRTGKPRTSKPRTS